MTDDVVAHVLYDSFLQAQISPRRSRCRPARLYAYEDLMSSLEEDGLLDRASEDLPDRRGARPSAAAPGAAWSAPSSPSLLAFAKRFVAARCSTRRSLDDPWLERDLRDYFPRRSSSASASAWPSTRCGAS